MKKTEANQELLLRYLDGDLRSEESTLLEGLLRSNTVAREFLRDVAQQAVVIADVERMHSSVHEPNNVNARRRATPGKWVVAVAAVAVLGLIASVFLWRPSGEPEIATITELNGSVDWTGDGGQVSHDLALAQRLPGGTLELLSADSWVELKFHDGSTVTLSGQSMMTVSEREQKEIHLRHGSLSASIEPQPAGYPMLVHTQAADLEVLGTQFNVDARSEATKLTVNEGRVRLKRLTDGKVVNVPAKHEVIAAIEDQNGLALYPRGEDVFTWQSDLKSDVVQGKWAPGLWTLGQRLKKAVAAGEMTEDDAISAFKEAVTLEDERGSVWGQSSPFGSLVLLSVSQKSATPVVMASGAKFRIRGRLHTQVDVEFGISTNKPHGGYAGKYSVSIPADALRGDENAFDIELPLSDFRPMEARFGGSPIGKELANWWCVTKSKSAMKGKSTKLEITGVELVE